MSDCASRNLDCSQVLFPALFVYNVPMAKRPYVDIRRKKSRSRKTKKRLAAKATMLAAKKGKKR